jgi:hypothetical protein
MGFRTVGTGLEFTRIVTHTEFVQRFASAIGLTDLPCADRLCHAAVASLVCGLPDPVETLVRAAVPVDPGSLTAASKPRSVADLAGELAQRTGVSRSQAAEALRAAGIVIADALDPDTLRAVLDAVPEDVSALFLHRESAERPVAPRVQHGRGHTLATGRPGSRHPVSDSSSAVAQTHSVAREANPHEEGKLSSGHVHHADPLSEREPGSRSPLTDAGADRVDGVD